MVFIHFIFDTLCTLIHRCQYTSSYYVFQCAVVFPGKRPSHSLHFLIRDSPKTHTDRQTERERGREIERERDYFQLRCSAVSTPEKIAYTSDLELDWAAPSWLSTGVKLQSPNKDYAN